MFRSSLTLSDLAVAIATINFEGLQQRRDSMFLALLITVALDGLLLSTCASIRIFVGCAPSIKSICARRNDGTRSARQSDRRRAADELLQEPSGHIEENHFEGSCGRIIRIYDSDTEEDVDEEFGELEDSDEEEHEDEEIEEDSDDGEFPEVDDIRLSALASKLREENMKNLNWTRKRFTPPDVTFDDAISGGENDIPTPPTYFFKYFPNPVFHHFNLAVCNSWLEYQRDLKRKGEIEKDLLQFTVEVAEGLAFSGYANTPRRGRPLSSSPIVMNTVPAKRLKPSLRPLSDIRYDNVGRWPIHEDGNEQRCKLESCGGRSRIQCEKCNVHLCLTKHKTCFKSFHCK